MWRGGGGGGGVCEGLRLGGGGVGRLDMGGEDSCTWPAHWTTCGGFSPCRKEVGVSVWWGGGWGGDWIWGERTAAPGQLAGQHLYDSACVGRRWGSVSVCGRGGGGGWG